MSTTETKRPLIEAEAQAYEFRDLFADTYERWEIAGSIRRRKPFVGDCEHVVIPKFDNQPGPDLFATPERVNLMLQRCDVLIASMEIAKHVYGMKACGELVRGEWIPAAPSPIYRWGEIHRGCDFRGFNHEIFSAMPANFGSTLAIRTGPAELSKRLVTRLHDSRHRAYNGCVWACDVCPDAPERGKCPDSCQNCQGTGLRPLDEVYVPTEESFFALAGIECVKPEMRI